MDTINRIEYKLKALQSDDSVGAEETAAIPRSEYIADIVTLLQHVTKLSLMARGLVIRLTPRERTLKLMRGGEEWQRKLIMDNRMVHRLVQDAWATAGLQGQLEHHAKTGEGDPELMAEIATTYQDLLEAPKDEITFDVKCLRCDNRLVVTCPKDKPLKLLEVTCGICGEKQLMDRTHIPQVKAIGAD